MKLSKAYGCFSYNLLFVKVAAYGFEKMSLDLITDYLTSHLQRVKIGLTLITYLGILKGLPQGSVVGPILLLTSS